MDFFSTGPPAVEDTGGGTFTWELSRLGRFIAGDSVRFAGTVGTAMVGSAELLLDGVDETVSGTKLCCAMD